MVTNAHSVLSGSALEPYVPRLARGWRAVAGEHSWLELDATLVSVDISGFTRLSERLAAKGRAGTEELIVHLGTCFEGLIGTAERRGGDVLKFRGDALLILFSGLRHEARGCEAAREMHALIDGMGRTQTSVGPLSLRMSTGIHSGVCHFFLVGTAHRELLVTGPAATMTVTLEKQAQAGQILLSETTAGALDARWLGPPSGGGGRLLRRGGPVGLPIETPASIEEPAAPELAQLIPDAVRRVVAGGGPEGEHRQVTAGFVRFHGTDAKLLAAGPEATAVELEAFANVAQEMIARYGVVWLESDIAHDGGVLYLTAGAPASSGTEAESMLRAVRAIVDGAAEMPVSAGIAAGTVFAGEIGGARRRTYAVLGDPVNTAARLMQRAAAGEVLATADVLDRSAVHFESQPLEPFNVRGRTRPVTAHRVGAIDRRRERHAPGQLPIVGRERELTELRDAYSAAAYGHGRVVELVGDAGLGKSRLVEELLAMAGETAVVTRADQYEAATPYFAFKTLLRTIAGVSPESSPEEAGAGLRAWVASVAPHLEIWLPLLAIPFNATVPETDEVRGLAPEFRRDQLQRSVLELLESALPTPTLLIIEDGHWLDEASQDLIRQVAGRISNMPWLVCVARRPFGPGYAVEAGDAGALIELTALVPAARSALVMAAAEAALPDDIIATLAERSGGNPLFLRELVAAAHRTDVVDSLPDTVESLITARMDLLRREDRQLLRAAAVAGASLDLDVLQEVLGGEVGPITDSARWEVMNEFVEWQGAHQARFRHDLFRAVAYEGLAVRRRRELHRRLADAIERRAGAAAAEEAGLLSLHFLRAEQYSKAWHYSVLAGRDAQSKFANLVAAELYERALAAAGQIETIEPESVAGVCESLGDVSELAARYEGAAKAYRAARRLTPNSDARSHARLMHKQGVLRERAGRYSDALRWYGRALRLLKSAAFEAADGATLKLTAEIELAYAGVLYRQGRYQASVKWAQRAADDAGRGEAQRSLGHAFYLLDAAYTDLGRPESTLYRERALPIFEEIGDLIGQGNVLNNLGIDAYYEGRWSEALELYARSRELKERAGDVVNAAIQSNNEAEILSDQGNLEAAEERLQHALRVWRAAKYPVGIALATSNLGRAAARGGRFDEAEALLGDALRQFRAIRAEGFVLETQARLVECMLLAGNVDRAGELMSEAFPADRQVRGVSVLEAFVERLRGGIEVARSDTQAARRHLEASLRVARGLGADFEVALTLNQLAAVDRLEGVEEGEAAQEAAAILERLDVSAVPEPRFPGHEERGD